MSERYSKLFALSENLYSAGAPVVIAAGALQKDNQTGKVFAQLKIRNIQDKAIKAATVKITPFDTVGKPLGGTVDYQYLDLSAKRDTDFGQKTPVMLKEAATRSFAASVSEVIFSDNSIWTASNEAWEPLSAPVTPDKEFINGELAKQYRVKYGTDCTCVFKKEKDLWRCACGAVNHDSEMNCHTCQRAAAALAALNVEELKADRDKRLAAEQKKAAEEKAAAEAQAKKTKKIAMIAAPIIVVAAIVAAVLILEKSAAYNAAVALAEAGRYGEARAAFEALGDYKDARTDDGVEVVSVVLPAVMTVGGKSAAPCRPCNVRRILNYRKCGIACLTADDLGGDAARYGLGGSPTQVVDSRTITAEHKDTAWVGADDESLTDFVARLVDSHIIE